MSELAYAALVGLALAWLPIGFVVDARYGPSRRGSLIGMLLWPLFLIAAVHGRAYNDT